MSELERILDNIKPEKLTMYALYGTEWSAEHICTYDTALESAYDTFLGYLKEQCPGINETALDDKLIHFIFTYSEIYLEMGMIAGYVLNKEMESKFHALGLDAVIEHMTKSGKETE